MKKGIKTKKTKIPQIRTQLIKNQILNLAKAKVTPALIWTVRMKTSCTLNCCNNKRVQWLWLSKKTKVLIWMNWLIKRWFSCLMFVSVCIAPGWKLCIQSLSILGQILEIKKHSFWIWMRPCSMLNSCPMTKMKLMMMAILFSRCKVKILVPRMFRDSVR